MSQEESKAMVGMISGVSRLDDSAFLFSAWSGLRALDEEHGMQTLILESDEDEETIMNARYLAHAGYQVLWAVGYGTQEAVEFVAPKFPGLKICAVDMEFSSPPPNVLSVRFDEHHGAFLAGLVAARSSAAGKVGFIGGVQSSLMDRFEAGFAQGVEYAGNADAMVDYCGSFVSFQAGRDAADKLYDRGCDVLFHAAGAAGRGVIRSAKELNKKVIGVDRDQSFLAPQNVITSMLKRIDTAVVSLSRSVIDGRQAMGGEIHLGLREEAIRLAPLRATLVPEGIEEEIKTVSDAIIAGDIEIRVSTQKS